MAALAALLLAVSRAVGETMIVTMAAGLQAKLTANPLDTVTTVTVQIVTLLTGDQEFDSPKTLAAFGLGLTLFVTLAAIQTSITAEIARTVPQRAPSFFVLDVPRDVAWTSVHPEARLDPVAEYGRSADLYVEIGSGQGHAIVSAASSRPGDDFLAVEVFRAGLARTMLDADRAGARPATLSGGEQQRVAIARSLANSPRLLLADEPTGNLDTQMARGVMELLEEINAAGTTILMVTHDPELAVRTQRNVHIIDGQVSDLVRKAPSLSNVA